MIFDLYLFTGLAKIRARNNYDPMKTGEIRKFKIDKNIKKECGLPGQGVIEIEIKKEKAKFSRFQFTLVGHEDEAFLHFDDGYLTILKTEGKAEKCGIGRIFTDLCMREPNFHKKSSMNQAFFQLKKYIKIGEKRNGFEEKTEMVTKLKDWAASHCSRFMFLRMIAKPRTGAHVYFNSAIASGFTEMFMVTDFPRNNKELLFYPNDGPCEVKEIQGRYSDDGNMVDEDKKTDVGKWNWFFCKPKKPNDMPKCTIL